MNHVDDNRIGPSRGSDDQIATAGDLGLLLDASARMLTVKDMLTGRFAYASKAFCALLSVEAGDVVGRTDTDLFDASVAAVMRASDGVCASRRLPTHSDHDLSLGQARRTLRVVRYCVRDADGREWIWATWADASDEQSAHLLLQARYEAAKEQIDHQQRALAELRRELAEAASRDDNSGLHPRSHFDEQLRREVDLSIREHREFAIVFLCLDPGADGTDPPELELIAITQSLGRILKSGTRAMDASCRWDAWRFAVLLSGVGLATAHSRMEGLRRQCATQIVMSEGRECRFTVAMGVASYPHTADDADSLQTAGLNALDEARRRGGNQVTLAAIRLDAA